MNQPDRRIELILLDPDNITRDLDSAPVRMLVDAGYRPGPAFLYQQAKDAPHRIAVLMHPPLPPPAPDPAILALAEFVKASALHSKRVAYGGALFGVVGLLCSALSLYWRLS